MSAYDVSKSAAFSSRLINDANSLAISINNRLFFAAGYNPKPFKDGSGELLFWTAITNLYGLFEDCSNPFIKGNLLDCFVKSKLVERMFEKELRNFRDGVKSARSIFCHNNSGETGYAIKQYSDFLAFLRELCNCDNSMQAVINPSYTAETPCTPELSNDLWLDATESICCKADSLINILIDSIRQVLSSNQAKELSDAWIKAISERSRNNGNARYQVLYDICKRLVLEAKTNASERDIRHWVNKKEREVKELSCLDAVYVEVINSVAKPPISCEIAYKVLVLLEKRGHIELCL